MGVDKKTKPSFVNIVLDDNKKYLDTLRKQAEADGQNDEGKNKLSLNNDNYSFEMEEFYFGDSSTPNEIVISGSIKNNEGESSIYIAIPVSDIVLIDMLSYSLKKFNKLKTALETLK